MFLGLLLGILVRDLGGDESEGFGLWDFGDVAFYYSGGSLEFPMNPMCLTIW